MERRLVADRKYNQNRQGTQREREQVERTQKVDTQVESRQSMELI